MTHDNSDTDTMAVLHITFKHEPIREQHIRDAQNATDWPGDELHEVVVNPDEITVEGTPTGIRWLYDFLDYLVRAWRQEGEQWDADVAEEMANTVWDAVDGDLPDQQRPRRVTDGGESPAKVASRDDLDECWCCGGLHDSVRALCADCDETGCQHFGGECQSDHKPVLADGGTDEYDTVDATLSVGGADCEVTSARLVDCDDRRLTLRLTEDGLREFITELRLQEFDAGAAEWLADHSTGDLGALNGGEGDE